MGSPVGYCVVTDWAVCSPRARLHTLVQEVAALLPTIP